jgi:hypothetical protein
MALVLICGRCAESMTTFLEPDDASALVKDAAKKGWRMTNHWGWLCPVCVERLASALPPSGNLEVSN